MWLKNEKMRLLDSNNSVAFFKDHKKDKDTNKLWPCLSFMLLFF